MFAELLFYLGVAVSLVIALLYFRDLGDIPQLFIKTKRTNVDRFIRNEYKFRHFWVRRVAGLGDRLFRFRLWQRLGFLDSHADHFRVDCV